MNPENPSCPAPLLAFRLRHRDSWGPCALRWSSGPGDGAPDGLTPEDFHDMARILESTARDMRREADKRWAERKREAGERHRGHFLCLTGQTNDVDDTWVDLEGWSIDA